MNRFIQAGIRGADLGTGLLRASQGSQRTQGRSTDFEPVDPHHGLKSGSVATYSEGIGGRLVVPPGDQGIDWCGRSGQGVIDQFFFDSLVLNQTQPVEKTAEGRDFRPLPRGRLDQASIRKPRLEGSTDHPETITIGHDASDVVTTRAELNERHGHDDLELGIRTGRPGHESELDGRYRVSQEGPWLAHPENQHLRAKSLFGRWSGSPPIFVRVMLTRPEPESRPQDVKAF